MIFKPKNKAAGKGRNGYFNIEEIELWENPASEQAKQNEATDLIFMEVYSKRRGNSPPLRIIMSPTDLWRLGQTLQKMAVNGVVLNDPKKPL